MAINISNTAQDLTKRAIAQRDAGNLSIALDLFQQALAAQPSALAHANLADAQYVAGLHDLAIASYDAAIAVDPNLHGAKLNRANILRSIGRLTEALAVYHALLEIPSLPQNLRSFACNNIALTLHDQGHIDEAIPFYQQAADLDPANSRPLSNRLLAQACRYHFDPDETLALARQWWQRYTSHIIPSKHLPPDSSAKNRPLRVGFVSGDLRFHSVAYFLLPLFQKYDRSRFHFYCYAHVERPDRFSKQFHELATAWRNILPSSDAAAANMIRFDNIDVLLDLAGHTGDNRLAIFAHRPAPVQIAWLGYPLTTGSPHIQYRITDEIADPEGMTDPHFSETLIRLGGGRPAWCYHPLTTLPDYQMTKSPDHPFTFGSFNALSKLNPQTLALYAQILTNVPNSRLLLKNTPLADPPFAESLRQKFAALNVNPDRLLLLPRHSNIDDHLAAHAQLDLALDTYPYNGTTTTCQALHMNVPVLTLAGQFHHSRVSASLLTALDLPELITHTPGEFVQRAIHLATTPDALVPYKNLRQKIEASSLMNHSNFTHTFCSTVRRLYLKQNP